MSEPHIPDDSVPQQDVAPDSSAPELRDVNRRSLLAIGVRTAVGLALGGLAVSLASRARPRSTVWQIDPDRCVQCERCATACVLTPSAVKCVHKLDQCGYCVLCGGYHAAGIRTADSGAENQLCPTGAIERRFIEDPFYEYTVLEERCIGCGKCVKGCGAFGNGSLYLQIRHDRCQNCNECAIMAVCPSGAIRRVTIEEPYVLRGDKRHS